MRPDVVPRKRAPNRVTVDLVRSAAAATRCRRPRHAWTPPLIFASHARSLAGDDVRPFLEREPRGFGHILEARAVLTREHAAKRVGEILEAGELARRITRPRRFCAASVLRAQFLEDGRTASSRARATEGA